MDTVSIWLKKTREKKAQTQMQAAQAVSVHVMTWSAWERGAQLPTGPGTIARIARWADVSIESVLRRVQRSDKQRLEAAG